MNKKIIKAMSVLLLIAIILVFSSTVCTAKSSIIAPGDVTPIESPAQADILSIGQKIVGVLQAIGVVVSVVVLIVLGIKYMMGSAEEKAEYKKTFIPYIVGAALIFSASIIAGAIVSFLTK